MTDHSVLAQVLVFLIAAVIAAALFRRLRTSMVLGFLAGGIAIGPHGFGVVDSTETAQELADLGVVFLMFLIGLELSVKRLIVMRGLVFGLGLSQVLVTGLAIGAAAWFAGVDAAAAIVIGVGLAFSSTAVVLQLLAERGEIATRAGRISVAVLLLQDLAVVPMLTLIPALAGTGVALLPAIGVALVKAAAAFGLIYLIGRFLLRPVMRVVAATRSSDLFSATTLLVLLGMAWITGQAGLSLALGGFLAGLLLAGTEYRHEVAADMEPFAGLLLGLFFMVVGMTVDLPLIAANIAVLAAIVVGLIAVKAALLAGLIRLFGLGAGAAVRVGLVLAQGGEFSFLLFIFAAGEGLMPQFVASLLVAAVSVTMALTPFLAAIAKPLAARLDAQGVDGAAAVADGDDKPTGHVVIAGYGRVGQSVAKMLAEAGIAYVAIEFEPTRVAEARAQGLPVFYGDARRPEVLNAVGAARARVAVVIMDNAETAERTVEYLHRHYPALDIFARARDNRHRRRLEQAGATGIIHETFEMSLQLGGAVLRRLGTSDSTIQNIILGLRAENYAPLTDVIFPAEGATTIAQAEPGTAIGLTRQRDGGG